MRSGWGSLRFGNPALWNSQKKENHPFGRRFASAILPDPKEARQ
jgi:hypothetical protein